MKWFFTLQLIIIMILISSSFHSSGPPTTQCQCDYSLLHCWASIHLLLFGRAKLTCVSFKLMCVWRAVWADVLSIVSGKHRMSAHILCVIMLTIHYSIKFQQYDVCFLPLFLFFSWWNQIKSFVRSWGRWLGEKEQSICILAIISAKGIANQEASGVERRWYIFPQELQL